MKRDENMKELGLNIMNLAEKKVRRSLLQG